MPAYPAAPVASSATPPGSSPDNQATPVAAAPVTPAAAVILTGQASLLCSRRWAASQSVLTPSGSASAGDRGGGPGSGPAEPCCQPRYTRSSRIRPRGASPLAPRPADSGL